MQQHLTIYLHQSHNDESMTTAMITQHDEFQSLEGARNATSCRRAASELCGTGPTQLPVSHAQGSAYICYMSLYYIHIAITIIISIVHINVIIIST